MNLTRRRLARLAGAVAASAAAGCLDDGRDPDGGDGGDAAPADDPDADDGDGRANDPAENGGSNDDANGDEGSDSGATPPEGAVVDGTVVNYPAFVDDEASVAETDDRIEYGDPETEFELDAGYDGDEAAEDDLRIDRDLSGDRMAAFVAPAYDDGFVYHAFANEAFVEFADWHALAFDEDEPADEPGPAFAAVTDRVYYRRVTPSFDEAGIAIVDAPADVARDPPEDLSGIAVTRVDDPDGGRGDVPAVAFEFDRDPEAGVVRIRHVAGDALDGERVAVSVDGERVGNPFDVETVTAGDVATVEAPGGATIRVVYDHGGELVALAADGSSAPTVRANRFGSPA